MYHRRYAIVTVVAVALVSLTGCDSERPVSPLQPNDAQQGLDGGQMPRVLDEEFELTARTELPGFAGYYLDANGDVVVLVTDTTHAAAARDYGGRKRALHGQASRGGSVRLHQVNFDFAQLSDWSRSLLGQLAAIGSFSMDIDEVRNHIWIGYEDANIGAAIRRSVAASGLPAEAVQVEYQPLGRPSYTLRDDLDTLMAGIQVWADGASWCTHGFTAIYQGQASFVMNSHCTRTPWQSDGGTIRQAWDISRRVGAEVWDRSFYFCRYPPQTHLCRYSDAAVIRYDAGVASRLGGVAWPSDEGYYRAGSIDIGDPPQWYYISTKWTSSIPVGAVVGKVGVKSGRTIGHVTRSCFRVALASPSGRYLECQYQADVWGEPGDSGAPWLLYSHPNPGAALAGIHWGRIGNNFTETLFSPITGIERDLGATLSVCYPGWGC